MYDTVKLWQSAEMLESGYLQRVPTILTNVGFHQKANGIEYITGSLDNLNVVVSMAGISINGSLNKFWHKDNFNKLTRQETEHCAELLENTMNIKLKDAEIKRFDIAHNFLMTAPVKNYYSLLGESSRFTRFSQENSVYYNNGQRVKLFYDKVSEGKYRGIEIPEVWNLKNVLRYELRFTSRIAKQFKRDKVILSDLYNDGFYVSAIDFWSKEYLNIKKNKLLTPTILNMTTKNAKEYLLSALIDLVGHNEVNKLTEGWKANFSTTKEAQRFKASLKNMKNLTEDSPLMAELDMKILRVKEYYR